MNSIQTVGPTTEKERLPNMLWQTRWRCLADDRCWWLDTSDTDT